MPYHFHPTVDDHHYDTRIHDNYRRPHHHEYTHNHFVTVDDVYIGSRVDLPVDVDLGRGRHTPDPVVHRGHSTHIPRRHTTD